MKTNTRKCTIEDLHTLHEIGCETYIDSFKHLNTPENMESYLQKSFNSEQLEKELSNVSSTFLFLYVNEELAGYLKVNVDEAQTYITDSHSLEIQRIYLRKNFQGKGLGKFLLNKVLEIAKIRNKTSIWLEVLEKNKEAIKFYEKMGFETNGSNNVYVGDVTHLLYIMIKKID